LKISKVSKVEMARAQKGAVVHVTFGTMTYFLITREKKGAEHAATMMMRRAVSQQHTRWTLRQLAWNIHQYIINHQSTDCETKQQEIEHRKGTNKAKNNNQY
jgi:hypothetical protein